MLTGGQYMLGDSLLAAPIFRDDSIAVLSAGGTWTSLLTGEVKEGGKWYTEKHGYLSIPLYVKRAASWLWVQEMTMRFMIMRTGDIPCLCIEGWH